MKFNYNKILKSIAIISKKIFLLLILITFSGQAQQLSNVEVKKTFYPNGNIKTEGEYQDNILTGLYREYYLNGKLWKQWNFEDGLENGLSTWYFEDGLVSIEWNYYRGNRDGTSRVKRRVCELRRGGPVPRSQLRPGIRRRPAFRSSPRPR